MTNRSQYESDIKTAAATKLATLQTAANTLGESINAVGAAPNGGTSLAFGVTAAQDVAIRNACKTYYATALAAEATKHATITNSRAKNCRTTATPGRRENLSAKRPVCFQDRCRAIYLWAAKRNPGC